MIRLMLRAAGFALAPRPTEEPARAPTPDEQLRRFAEVCERLSVSEEPADAPGSEDPAVAAGTRF